jgi:hypothetical protein
VTESGPLSALAIGQCLHLLRDIYGTVLVPEAVLRQRILGHSAPQITSDTCTHLSPAHLAGAADRVSFPTAASTGKVIGIRSGF